jgi:hypothetical protein
MASGPVISGMWMSMKARSMLPRASSSMHCCPLSAVRICAGVDERATISHRNACTGRESSAIRIFTSEGRTLLLHAQAMPNELPAQSEL